MATAATEQLKRDYEAAKAQYEKHIKTCPLCREGAYLGCEEWKRLSQERSLRYEVWARAFSSDYNAGV